LEKQVAAALIATKEVYNDPGWRRWAQAWLDGTDRSRTSARVAEAAAIVEMELAAYRFDPGAHGVAAAAAELAGRLAVSLAEAERLRSEGKPVLAEFVEAMAADMAELACRASLSAR
jgi:hypothetical protein